jgi:hypothetical protein
VTVSSLAVEVQLDLAPTRLKAGSGVRATLRIRNTGGVELVGCDASLFFDSDGITIATGPSEIAVPIFPGKRDRVRWRLVVAEPGTYVVVASLVAEAADGATLETETPGMVLRVRDSKKRKR